MLGYYKVHKNNFDSFITFIVKKYKNFQNYDLDDFKEYYYFNDSDYLYLCVQEYSYDKYIMTYMYYSSESEEWYRENSVSCCGEYYARQEKLEKLDKVIKMSDEK